MSKYDPLWQYLKAADNEVCKLSYDEIKKITGFVIDHSFLTYKKRLRNMDMK